VEEREQQEQWIRMRVGKGPMHEEEEEEEGWVSGCI
jgi:hypothetical protein